MDASAQATFFGNKLGATLPPLRIAAFERDLLTANLALMDAALQQVAATARTVGASPRDARAAVWAEYDRRVADIQRLFPVFFTFESAWRTLSAAVLRQRYGGDDGWWHPVRAAMAAGSGVSRVGYLGGVPARNEVVRRVENILRNQPTADLHRMATSYDLLEVCTLGDVSWMIDRHWSAVASTFSATALPAPTSAIFADLFRRVREARNDAYHHRPVSDGQKVIAAAERLLDLVDVHLGARVATTSSAALGAFAFAVLRQPRHG